MVWCARGVYSLPVTCRQGLGLALLGHPVRALLLVLLTTVTVEFSQYHWLVGRDASLRDILTNSLGGGLGVALAGIIMLRAERRRLSDERMAFRAND